MNIERDKFLTEAMCECWHEWEKQTPVTWLPASCIKCDENELSAGINDFSTWEGFGKLWEWSQKQDWWLKFHEYLYPVKCYDSIEVELIHPDRFANTIYEYLKVRGVE